MAKVKEGNTKAHVLVLTYPTAGHTNPMLQFSKHLASKGLQVTFVNFEFDHQRTLQATDSNQRLHLDIRFESIPDELPPDFRVDPLDYTFIFKHLHELGGRELERLVRRLNGRDGPTVSCIIYDSFLPWVPDVANNLGIPRALFSTQSAAVTSIYYHYKYVENWNPDRKSESLKIPGLPEMNVADLPNTFLSGEYAFDVLRLLLDDFENMADASWVFVNSFYELEGETIEYMRRVRGVNIRAIGPSIPSAFLDRRNPEDSEVGTNPWKSWECTEWLNGKSPSSVIYVSFGSITVISSRQIQELAEGLRQSQQHFVWVIRPPPGYLHISDILPRGFLEGTKERGLVVPWVHQLEVLSHPSVAAFMTHCGWNSTLDALCLGVPMLCLGVWTDQITNSKFVSDIWKTGLRLRKGDDGIVGREEVARCVRLIIEGEECAEVRHNTMKWKEAARKAMMEGGSSDQNLNDFVEQIVAKAETSSSSVKR